MMLEFNTRLKIPGTNQVRELTVFFQLEKVAWAGMARPGLDLLHDRCSQARTDAWSPAEREAGDGGVGETEERSERVGNIRNI